MSDQQNDQAQGLENNEQKQNVDDQQNDSVKDQDDQQKASENKSEDKNNFQSRIDQLTARAKAAEDEVRKFREEQSKKEEEEMMNKGEHERLLGKYKSDLEDATSKLGRMTELEEALNSHLESQINLIPEEKRALIPESFTPEQKLKYISQNRSFLTESNDKQNNKPQVNTGTSIPKNESGVTPTKVELQEKLDGFLKKKREVGYLDPREKGEVQKLVKEIKSMESKEA